MFENKSLIHTLSTSLRRNIPLFALKPWNLKVAKKKNCFPERNFCVVDPLEGVGGGGED